MSLISEVAVFDDILAIIVSVNARKTIPSFECVGGQRSVIAKMLPMDAMINDIQNCKQLNSMQIVSIGFATWLMLWHNHRGIPEIEGAVEKLSASLVTVLGGVQRSLECRRL